MMPNKHIVLIEPSGTEHVLWATVIDLGGRDTEIDLTTVGIWRSRFEFTWDLVTQPLIDEEWGVVDHRGQKYTVESLLEPSGKRIAERKVFVIARRT